MSLLTDGFPCFRPPTSYFSFRHTIEILGRDLHSKGDSELFYYRTSNGLEVDLIIDRKVRREYFKIKYGATYRSEMTRSIETVKDNYEHGYLLDRGRKAHSTPDLTIVNYQTYLEGSLDNGVSTAR